MIICGKVRIYLRCRYSNHAGLVYSLSASAIQRFSIWHGDETPLYTWWVQITEKNSFGRGKIVFFSSDFLTSLLALFFRISLRTVDDRNRWHFLHFGAENSSGLKYVNERQKFVSLIRKRPESSFETFSTEPRRLPTSERSEPIWSQLNSSDPFRLLRCPQIIRVSEPYQKPVSFVFGWRSDILCSRVESELKNSPRWELW